MADIVAPRWPRLPMRLLSGVPPGTRLQVLMFHRVHAAADPLFPDEMTAPRFRECLSWIREWFNVLPLGEAVASFDRRTLPARAMAITFDDGYRDNATVAMPILRELGLPATFFVSTGFLDGGRMWNDTVIEALRRTSLATLALGAIGLPDVPSATLTERRAAIATLLPKLKHLGPDARRATVSALADVAGAVLPDDLMMTSSQVRELSAAGMEIGAHTVSHPILAVLDEASARREIADGADAIAAITGKRARLFAYPNGKPHADYRARDVALVKSLGFDAAFSTSPGVATAHSPRYELPRFTPWDRTPARWALRLMRNYATSGDHVAAA
jgi:peptidoglycan/xylan/chitin deacetylase (PgdA/CDA1 family)